MSLQRDVFFSQIKPQFSGRLSKGQTQGLTAMLDYAEGHGTVLFHLAYALATAFHETARTMQPVRETLASTDEKAITLLDKAFKAGKLGQVNNPYWRKDAAGKSWLGRGLVQLTHKSNYEKMSMVTGIDLVADPARAMDMATAVTILFIGMDRGSFTGKSLWDFISADGLTKDYKGARKVINGTDKALTIAGYAKAFESALSVATYAPIAPANPGAAPVLPAKPKPAAKPKAALAPAPEAAAPAAVVVAERLDPEKLDKSLFKSKTVWQWVITTVLMPVLAVFNDWRVQLAIVVLIACFAIYAIKRRNDLKNVVRGIKDDLGV